MATASRLARSHYENFPVGSRLVPKRLRKHFYSIYAFARIADDFADEGYGQGYSERERLDAIDRVATHAGRIACGTSEASGICRSLANRRGIRFARSPVRGPPLSF